jgi:hypothetical protein
MIITQLNSGLGNQMFQYAAGKSLASFKNTELQIDISWYHNKIDMQTPRSYELSVFKLNEKLNHIDAVNNYYHNGNLYLNKIINKIERNIPYYKRKLYSEQKFDFDTNFFKARRDSIISGYWQSERYFENISNKIREIFTCKNEDWGIEDQIILKSILSSESVSLHIRRGDMISNPEVAKVHNACDLNYYNDSISLLNSKLVTPNYYVFSDDIEWAKENIKTFNKTTFINHNIGNLAWLDMQLMARCKHNIIANSSFSWWGAWLNNNKEKIVISPKKWFNTSNNDTKDLIPNGWIRL